MFKPHHRLCYLHSSYHDDYISRDIDGIIDLYEYIRDVFSNCKIIIHKEQSIQNNTNFGYKKNGNVVILNKEDNIVSLLDISEKSFSSNVLLSSFYNINISLIKQTDCPIPLYYNDEVTVVNVPEYTISNLDYRRRIVLMDNEQLKKLENYNEIENWKLII